MHNSLCLVLNTKQEVFTSGGLVGFAGFGRGGRGIEGGGGCKKVMKCALIR